MEQKKKQQIAEALAGISYGDWKEIESIVEHSYHVTKKELTSAEISSKMNAFPLHSDDSETGKNSKNPMTIDEIKKFFNDHQNGLISDETMKTYMVIESR